MKVQIDRSTWKTVTTGKGETRLCNVEGYKCCLGFIALQYTTVETIMNIPSPGILSNNIKTEIPGLSVLTYHHDIYHYKTSDLGVKAMDINDNPETTPQEKEQLLIDLFKDSIYTLEFVGEYNETPNV